MEGGKRYEYQKSEVTDNFVELKKKVVKEIAPPFRILIVSPTSNGCDHILDLLTPISKNFKIVRLGQSISRSDLDKKFGININPKEENS